PMGSTGSDHFVMAITSDVRNKTYQNDDHHSATTEECSHDDDECQPVLQEFMLNLSAKRRLCNTVGKRFIDGTARCCAVSIARSRAAATTNFARSNQSLVLRGPRRPGAKSCGQFRSLFLEGAAMKSRWRLRPL